MSGWLSELSGGLTVGLNGRLFHLLLHMASSAISSAQAAKVSVSLNWKGSSPSELSGSTDKSSTFADHLAQGRSSFQAQINHPNVRFSPLNLAVERLPLEISETILITTFPPIPSIIQFMIAFEVAMWTNYQSDNAVPPVHLNPPPHCSMYVLIHSRSAALHLVTPHLDYYHCQVSLLPMPSVFITIAMSLH